MQTDSFRLTFKNLWIFFDHEGQTGPSLEIVGIFATGTALALADRYALRNSPTTIGFEMAERFQHLMAQMGLGLKQGSYNKFAHIPFIGGEHGSGGFVNEMLMRRVLPAYAGYKALQYFDFKLGHKPSEMLAAISLKVEVLHAELTDKIPGARKLTDFYANVVPGGQYGALALPVGGAFIGGTIAYAERLF